MSIDAIRQFIKKSVPVPIIMNTLRLILTMPASSARFLIKDLTKPTQLQSQWIKYIAKDHWKGAFIGPSLASATESEAVAQVSQADLVIFNIHGGAFRVGHCTMYMDAFIRWLQLLKTRHGLNAVIFSIEYGLAPENKYPGPVMECMAAFEYLTKTLQVPACQIVLTGDSAGGTLCLETLVRLFAPDLMDEDGGDAADTAAARCSSDHHDIDIPAGLVLVSPLVSPNTEAWLWQQNDFVSPRLAACVQHEYFNVSTESIADLPLSRLSLLESDFVRFLPQHLAVYVGNREVMRDDILTMARRITQDHLRHGRGVHVNIYSEDYAHDWYFIREIVPVRQRAAIFDKHDAQFTDFCVHALQQTVKANKAVPVVQIGKQQPMTSMIATRDTVI
ncbi:Alpha/Beta hydrolase protein [Radiomyces spectabilis]|uniref:Alpha/Beta hydrolase protein n=1 Tax=Radiomyces spectabilis TaxID=64574 RepID=UPI00221EE6C7|nr:Alpha/Beta hydrolase protein [Radiomyces spectabilis]KAI8381370.1 Alpha/Beta hydrolase protein [Radiomyces spectabilis]